MFAPAKVDFRKYRTFRTGFFARNSAITKVIAARTEKRKSKSIHQVR